MTDPDRLRELAMAATPGKWKCFYKHKYDEWHVSVPLEHSTMGLALFPDGCKTERPGADAEFIAAVNPVAILALLDRLDAAERMVRIELTKPDDYTRLEAKVTAAETARDKANKAYSDMKERAEDAEQDCADLQHDIARHVALASREAEARIAAERERDEAYERAAQVVEQQPTTRTGARGAEGVIAGARVQLAAAIRARAPQGGRQPQTATGNETEKT